MEEFIALFVLFLVAVGLVVWLVVTFWWVFLTAGALWAAWSVSPDWRAEQLDRLDAWWWARGAEARHRQHLAEIDAIGRRGREAMRAIALEEMRRQRAGNVVAAVPGRRNPVPGERR